jgi:hypothetical protein
MGCRGQLLAIERAVMQSMSARSTEETMGWKPRTSLESLITIVHNEKAGQSRLYDSRVQTV